MTLTATTLAAHLGVDDLVMTLAAAISSDTHERGFVVQIEAEYILVERRVARTNPQIVRGFLGTERAAHDSGEAVTPVVLVAQTDPPVEPPSSGGGGGVTNPVLEAFAVTPSADPGPASGLTVQTAPDQSSDTFDVLNADGGTIFSIGVESGLAAQDPDTDAALLFSKTGSISATDADGNEYLTYSPGSLQLDASGGVNAKTDPNSGYGYLLLTATQAPPDGFLFAGSVALWLDRTNGAAKLMVKAKSQDGTVVTGSVNLT